MKNEDYVHIIGSTVKVVASEQLDITQDLANNNEDNKTIAELLHEEEDQTTEWGFVRGVFTNIRHYY